MGDLDIPSVTASTMAEVDRLMSESYGVHLMQMMEHAGSHLARLAIGTFIGPNTAGWTVIVLAGTGGNGGGALACARHLHNQGVRVRVILTRPPGEYAGVPAHQLRIIERLGIEIAVGPPGVAVDNRAGIRLIVDGIVGYSLHGALTGVARELVEWTHTVDPLLLSLDVPSGFDPTSGYAPGAAVRADATLTLALPKTGFAAPGADAFTGDLYLADIGVPPEIYRELGIGLPARPIFAAGPVIGLKQCERDGTGVPRFVPYPNCPEEPHG